MQSPWPARYGVAKSGDPTLIVEAKGLKADTIRDVYFFPADWGPIASMAKQAASIGAEGIRIPLKRGDAKAALPADLSGTLVLTEKTADGEARQAFDVTAKLDPDFVPTASLRCGWRAAVAGRSAAVRLPGRPDPEPDALRVPGAGHEGRGLRAAGRPRGSGLRRHGVAYTPGVLATFPVMAAIVIAIRASAGDVSWGFQFQSPVFSLLIA